MRRVQVHRLPSHAWIVRVLVVIALGACGVLLTDYVLTTPVFCGVQHGCDQVIFSPYGRLMGIPLPVAGLFAFGSLLGLTFAPSAARVVGALSLFAGVAGLALFGVQLFAIGRFCPLCLLVDMCAMLLAVVELASPFGAVAEAVPDNGPRATTPARAESPAWPWLTAALVAIAGPLGWGVMKPSPSAPPEVRALWSNSGVTVVEVTDFACVYCRRNHPVLEAFLNQHGDRLRFVRVVNPLPHNKHARPAALAYLAAKRQGQADLMASALFSANDLSPEGCKALAANLGLDLDLYQADVVDPAIETELDAAMTWVGREKPQGLPWIWIQNQPLTGLQTFENLQATLRRAEAAFHGDGKRPKAEFRSERGPEDATVRLKRSPPPKASHASGAQRGQEPIARNGARPPSPLPIPSDAT